MIRLLHLCNDEKFIDMAINQFERLQNVKSVFVVCSKTPLKYVKTSNVVVLDKKEDVLNFVKNNPCDFVVFHSLFISLINISEIHKPIIWNSWGMDVYSDVSASRKRAITLSLYKPLTRKFVNDNLSLKNRIGKYLSSLYKWKYIRSLKRVKYVSTVFPEEYDFIKKVKKDVVFFPFRYISVNEGTFDTSASIDFEKKYVLLGNSLALTNNHLDILSNLESRKEHLTVIMPISYPQENKKYKDKLLEYIETLTYVHVLPIKEFMPYQEYISRISQCSCAIFGHIRQQAVGNISEMLRRGAKVFLYKDSFAYKHYTSMGCKVFCIEEDMMKSDMFEPFDEKFKLKNKAIIEKDSDPTNYMNQLQSFFDNL